MDQSATNLQSDFGLLGNKPAEQAQPTDTQLPPRDPETGRFVSPEEPTPAQPASPPSSHPQYLLDAAAYYGFSDEEIKDLPTDKLTSLVWKMNQNLEKMRQQDALSRTLQTSEERTSAVPPQAIEKPKDEFADLESEGIHPLIINRLRAVADENKALKEQLGEVNQRENRRQALTNAEIFDDAFEGLGKDFEKFFGSGSGMQMQKNDPNFKRRMAILTNAGLSENDTPRVKKQKIQSTAKEMFGPAIAPEPANDYNAIPKPNGKQLPSKPRVSEEDWKQGGLAPPTHREVDDLPDGEEKAMRNLAKKLNTTTSYAEDAGIKAGLLR